MTAARYWKLVKLDSAGKSRTQALPEVQSFFGNTFPNLPEPIAHQPIQQSLMAIARPSKSVGQSASKSVRTNDPQHSAAELSLRCFISKQIEQTCVQLEMQFGEMHGVRRSELFPLVLDDDGRPWKAEPEAGGSYQSVARQILETFDPQRASLSTWTIRLVKHHRELNQFLLECGVYLLSDWAILNDTTSRKLQRLAAGSLTAIEREQLIKVLDAYHQVYRRDRLAARQAGAKGQCPEPTPEQLQEMAELLGSAMQPSQVLRQLRAIADRVRADRIASRTGRFQTVSIHASGEDDSRDLDIAAPAAPSEEEKAADVFIELYREAFAQALTNAIKAAIEARTEKLSGEKAQQYLKALRLFHAEGLSMTAIAAQVGLEKQFQVTRLLKLKELREDVQHRMIDLLKRYVSQKASEFVSPEQLLALDQKIEAALMEQVQALMEEDAAQAQAPKSFGKGSRFARSICGVLGE